MLTGLAFQREADAAEILKPVTSGLGSIEQSKLAEFDAAVEDRDIYRVGAGIAWGVAGAGLMAGIFLYVFDEPAVQAPPPPPGQRGVDPGSKEPDAIELSVLPALGPDFSGLMIDGRF